MTAPNLVSQKAGAAGPFGQSSIAGQQPVGATELGKLGVDWGLPPALRPSRYFRVLKREIKRQYKQRVTDPRHIRSYLEGSTVRKLQIGVGANVRKGWLNTDISPVNPDIVFMDATARMPFDDNVFDYVFCEHMIEHIPYLAGRGMLEECRRVLKPGGRIRVCTPDLAKIVRLYDNAKTPTEEAYVTWSIQEFVPEADATDPTFTINNFMRNWGHQFIYNEAIMERALLHAGFSDIVKCELGASDHPALQGLENDSRMPPGFLELESMTFEAAKPI
jgi:predicted SAM-dependent methyltransferase